MSSHECCSSFCRENVSEDGSVGVATAPIAAVSEGATVKVEAWSTFPTPPGSDVPGEAAGAAGFCRPDSPTREPERRSGTMNDLADSAINHREME